MQHKLVVTGSDHVPVEINSGVIIRWQDMAATQEGDTISVQQIASLQTHTALAVVDDTNIVVLLLHFTLHGDIPNHVMIIAPAQGR